MIHEDILSRMAWAAGVNPVMLAEPWPPRSIAWPDEVGPELAMEERPFCPEPPCVS